MSNLLSTQVRIAVKARAISVLDGWVEIAGIIKDLGTQAVTNYKVGDKVIGFELQQSTVTTELVLDSRQVILIPNGLVSFEQAAACIIPGIYAFTAIHFKLHNHNYQI